MDVTSDPGREYLGSHPFGGIRKNVDELGKELVNVVYVVN
jgi:hypothetical protein